MKRTQKINDSFERCRQKVLRRGGDPGRECPVTVSGFKPGPGFKPNRGRRRKQNPEDLAAIAFERFHGHPPTERIVFESREHEHHVFAGVGKLLDLYIVPEGDVVNQRTTAIRLHAFKGAMLAMNEKETQLYIVGGDQELSAAVLKQFGVNPEIGHEQEILGKCVDIVYATVKSHLGKDGGDADYYHRFAEETAGKNRHLRILKSPTATYDVTNAIIGLWGGTYSIEPEGITD